MPRDDWDEPEEDWTDDIDDPGPDDFDSDSGEDESGRCPECGGTVFLGAAKCPACGHWFTAADHRSMGGDTSQPRIVRTIAAVLLVLLLIGLLVTGFRMF
jgi:hypothetical protein